MKIAIIGGGPCGLFMCKRLAESGRKDLEIHVFEKSDTPGAGMPYSRAGAGEEHVTNVSDNEIPEIVTHIKDWVHTAPAALLDRYHISAGKFNEYKVLPRLFFGEYLRAQFYLLIEKAAARGVAVYLHLQHMVLDVLAGEAGMPVKVETDKSGAQLFDACVICTGHYWPLHYEGKVRGYYDSPYPPSKLALKVNHPVAIRGSSLTAIDAIRTLSRHNGSFTHNEHGLLVFHPAEGSEDFKMVLHSRSGMLPAIRFHLDDPHLNNHAALKPAMIAANMKENNGFLSLDFVFEKAFKELLKEKEPVFYERIRRMKLEEFVHTMIELREQLEPFTLFYAEYKEAEQSIKRKEPVYWKEMLAALSFAMNYPAKHFSAEDMQRLQHNLSHLISIVIAFVPQSSAKELLALHAAGRLDIVAAGHKSRVEPRDEGGVLYHYTQHEEGVYYKTFIDAVGQAHLPLRQFPFPSLVRENAVSQAKLKFKSEAAAVQEIKEGNPLVTKHDHAYFLQVPGITIDDSFRIVDEEGRANKNIYMLAVPYMAGYNPDYSGLDFCEKASELVASAIFA